jgi:hypothetical protein
MSKLKGAGILGAIVLAGVILLTTFSVREAIGDFLVLSDPRIEQACSTTGLNSEVCLIVAGWLQRVGSYVIAGEAVPPAQLQKAVKLFQQPIRQCKTPCAGFGACDKCVLVVTELELQLAANGTAANIEDALDTACEGLDPTLTQQCLDQVANVPLLIDFILTFEPPVTACQTLGYCQ